MKETMEFLDKLIYIYFLYYLSNEARVRESPENKQNNPNNRLSLGVNTTPENLKDVESQSYEIRKTTKHIVSK